MSSLKDRPSPFFEISRVLVRFYLVARFVVNANHSIARAAETAGL